MATNVETSDRNDEQTLMNDTHSGNWTRLVLSKNIIEIIVCFTK